MKAWCSKSLDSPYRSGRQNTWIKIKCKNTGTYPIVAFVEKLGASPRRIASLYLGRYEDGQLLYAGKAESGFATDDLYDLRERLDPYISKSSPLPVPVKKPKATWVRPEVLAEVQFTSFTADGLLRFPVYKGVRDDLARPGTQRSSRTPPPATRAKSGAGVSLTGPEESCVEVRFIGANTCGDRANAVPAAFAECLSQVMTDAVDQTQIDRTHSRTAAKRRLQNWPSWPISQSRT